MTRSGSTLLFNIIREVLTHRWGEKLGSAWEEDLLDLPASEIYLLKTHTITPFYRLRAQQIFYSYRDVRVAAVSRLRKFKTPITLEMIDADIREYSRAKTASHLMVKYEHLLNNPVAVIEQVAEQLKIEADIEAIHQLTCNLNPPQSGVAYSKKTLLHSDHFTNTGDQEWREIINQDLQQEIHQRYRWWFEETGYSPD